MLNRATGFNVMDLLSFKGDMSLNMINITDSLGSDNFGKERGTLGHMLAAKNDPNAAVLFNRFIGLALQNYHFIWKQEQASGTEEEVSSNAIPKACIDAFWQEFMQKRNAHSNTNLPCGGRKRKSLVFLDRQKVGHARFCLTRQWTFQ